MIFEKDSGTRYARVRGLYLKLCIQPGKYIFQKEDK